MKGERGLRAEVMGLAHSLVGYCTCIGAIACSLYRSYNSIILYKNYRHRCA